MSGGWHADAQGFLDRWLRERELFAQRFLAQRPGWPWGKLLRELDEPLAPVQFICFLQAAAVRGGWVDWFAREDRKSTRLNSSHVAISYAVFCLKKKKK